MIFWEWKTGRIKSRLKAHSKVVITHEWLPHETVSCPTPTVNESRPLMFLLAVESYHSVVGWSYQTLGECSFEPFYRDAG